MLPVSASPVAEDAGGNAEAAEGVCFLHGTHGPEERSAAGTSGDEASACPHPSPSSEEG